MSIKMKFNSLLNKLNSNRDSNPVSTNDENCSYCNKPFTEEFWCRECDPFRVIEGWSSENSDIDKFIKDTMYDAGQKGYSRFLEWVPFNKFVNIIQIGEGGFSKVYSATWKDGKASYEKQNDESWKKSKPKPMNVALKRLNGSEDISAEYLNEIKSYWKFYLKESLSLKFYGMTKDPETNEFIMIIQLANKGNWRNYLSSNFKNILWEDKIHLLWCSAFHLKNLHKLGYFHKDFHSGNILQGGQYSYAFISDFGLSGPANGQKSNDGICGVLPYIAPEVLHGKQYTFSSDIYSFGVVMAELSSGKPPFHNRNHDDSLALEICNGLRSEIGKETPEIYKKLAYKCMNANPDKRPTSEELNGILSFWHYSINGKNQEKEKFGYKGEEIKSIFEEADKEIPNISSSHEKVPSAIYTSRIFTFSDLPNPTNSSTISSYLNDED